MKINWVAPRVGYAKGGLKKESMTTSTDQKRVIVTRRMLGICHMQVCAAKDATDEEILEACNRENPAGTQNGWGIVIREGESHLLPGQCQRYSDRFHFLVAC